MARFVEIYTIVAGAQTWRHTSADRDVVYNATVYTAEAMDRGKQTVPSLRGGGEHELEVMLRINHDFVKRWFQFGIPPKTTSVMVQRLNTDANTITQQWSGPVVSVSSENGTEAVLHVSCEMGPPLRKKLPTITAGRQCSHVLYDLGGCKVDKSFFSVTTTVIYVDGRTVRVDMGADRGGSWAQFGELKHSASGESMTIREQRDLSPGFSTIADLDMQMPIFGLKVGDMVIVRAGCAHDITTCSQKFSNQRNYGGFPNLPTRNPFFPTGFGVMEQQ